MNLNQITLPSVNVSRSIEFYKIMGFKLIVESLPNYARFEVPEGKNTFSIHEVASLPTGEGIWIYFECTHLDQQVESLKAKGLVFDSEPKDQSWLWREASLKDPDNNKIILYYAGENRLNPPWRV